jgi:isocitrate lyase
MGFLEDEDQKYLDDVQAVKAWWTDSRWRYTKRPYTAEQIVAKRGNLKIQYPSNDQSKKLWKILESNFEVRRFEWNDGETALTLTSSRKKLPVSPMAVSNQQCSPRWPNTSTPSTFPAGKVLPPPRPPMNPPPILPITPW